MANLHAITPLSKQVELFNFYTNKNIVIKLKPDLSAAQNAAYYYRKAKNKSIELEQMEQKLLSMRNKLIHQTTLLEHVMLVNNAKQLKQYQVKTKQQEVFPFKRFTYKDFEIWVGKNATNNDLLTQKYSHKNDMWLHAKDVSGSHTVIKHKAGKPFTKELIMYAAQVAAYYSKHKGNALAPVTYTLKKFVRKPKGAEPGQVIIDKEEVIMVEPKLA
jgi:predicted ribosome quality control (RQC) complex YloA/Tae2 family protein